IVINGQYPAPEIRLREGSMLRIEVENALPWDPTSIHWHGLLVPAGMDGVPDVSTFPIAPQRVFVYEYPLLQSGTYWYHSHWRLQEQIGVAGPFVIEARNESLSGSGSYTLHAVAIDGSGQAIGILHTPDATSKANLAIPKPGGRAL